MIGRIIAEFRLRRFRQTWRKLNVHNFTVPNNVFHADKVSVGTATYGDLVIDMYGATAERLSIGHYVSIANGVKFLLGGAHRTDTFSTYPFRVRLLGEKQEAGTRGPIVIGDDVWIGTDALILPGVTIHQGAIIGAGSVVAKDIEPYAIYVGNPARLVKFRFPEEVIRELRHVDFSRMTREFVRQHQLDLYTPLDLGRSRELRAALQASR
jgi:acetyltransferase-like isoleucine patch superfamily enzyme